MLYQNNWEPLRDAKPFRWQCERRISHYAAGLGGISKKTAMSTIHFLLVFLPQSLENLAGHADRLFRTAGLGDRRARSLCRASACRPCQPDATTMRRSAEVIVNF